MNSCFFLKKMLPCYPVSLFPCSPVLPLPCSPVTLFPCSLFPLFSCYPVPPLPCFLVPFFPCSPVTMFPRYPVSLFPCSPVFPLPCSPVTLFPSESVESFPFSSLNLKFFTQMKRPHSSVNGRGIFTWWISERLINIYFSSPVLSLLNINGGQARGRCPSLRCRCSLMWPFRDRERQKRRLGTTQLPLPRKLQQKGWGKTKKKSFESRGPLET